MALYQVNNFAGTMTRNKRGALNSGRSRMGKTTSVDPFSDTSVLRFNETPTKLDPTHSVVTDVIVGFAPNVESGTLYQYAIDRSGNLYKINTTTDAVSLVTSSLAITLKYGGGIKMIRATPSSPATKIAIAHDNGFLYCNIDGTSPTSPSLLASGNYQTWVANSPHPISDEFAGYIYIGNGNALAQFYIGSLAFTSNAILNDSSGNSSIPQTTTILGLEVDGEGRYMRIVITTSTNFQDVITTDPTSLYQVPLSRVLYWNGIDQTYDSFDPFSQTNTTSSFSYLGIDITFGQDWYGAGIFEESTGTTQKIFSHKNFRPPLPGAFSASGSMAFFGAPYLSTTYSGGAFSTTWQAGLFAYGFLDSTDEADLCNLLSIAPSGGSTQTMTVGAVCIAQNYATKSDQTTLANSKFYVSTYESGTSSAANLYSCNVTPGSGTPTTGIYETEIEQFTLPQRITRLLVTSQVTQSGVSFRIDLVDTDSSIPANFNYTYTAGTDITQLQGAIENMEWSGAGLSVKNLNGLGIRITQLGTQQPNIISVLVETTDVDKSALQS